MIRDIAPGPMWSALKCCSAAKGENHTEGKVYRPPERDAAGRCDVTQVVVRRPKCFIDLSKKKNFWTIRPKQMQIESGARKSNYGIYQGVIKIKWLKRKC